jgi:NAD(P)-dependent dehydrogenase (short-subunit alcohol dehydrogenase family)
VNAISPGFIDTPGLRELLTSTETDQKARAMVKSMPSRQVTATQTPRPAFLKIHITR